jgi:hypothetical protein
MKLLGRDPALWLAFLTAVISIAGTLGFRLLDQEQAALWNVAINAVAGAITAYFVRPISPVAFTYAIAALAQLGAAYGLNLTEPQLSQINAIVVPTLALLTRGQVSPIETALTDTTENPTPEAAEVNASKTEDDFPLEGTADEETGGSVG